MTVAIVGVGEIGGVLARPLLCGGEQVVLAARDVSNATGLADELGKLGIAAPIGRGIKAANVVVIYCSVRAVTERHG